MKRYASLLLLLASICTNAQHKLELLWQTDTIIAVPESVLHDPARGVLYVSLIDGGSWVADGKGGIAKLGLDGKKYDPNWITGLNAPKGMGIHRNRLYVADLSELVVVDIEKGKIEKRIAPDSAKGLNDVTITNKGIVYVSDSRTGRIWRVENDIATLYLDSMRGVNGLKAVDNDLYIAAGRTFLKADAQKQLTKIAELPQGGDGIEPIGNGDFIFTSWAGYIYYVHADGRFESLLETLAEKKNTADIAYDPEKKIVYVPTFNGRSVAAYQLR